MKRPLAVLTIAGADSGGGAGILADCRTISAAGAYPVAVITAITAQNLHGVQAWESVPVRLIENQIEALWEDFDIGAIKTGLLPGPETIRAIARMIGRHRARVPLVVDPVIGATTGARFLDASGIAVLKRDLFPLAALVTPNWPEAHALTGLPVRTVDEAAAAAHRLVAEGCRSVLVKGGHGPGEVVVDILVTKGGEDVRFEAWRIKTANTHGTGCVLSAGIATHLALGAALVPAIRRARRALRFALRGNRKIDWGGRGPVLG